MASSPTAPGRWLYGPVPDLLLGCGLWYVVALLALAGPGEAVREAGAATLLPFAVLFFSTPHYGATLLRVYARREDRRAYTFFAVHATIALALVFAVGTRQPLVGSLIVTLYLTWSPWHYTGQNYGIAVMFLRRSGVPLGPGTRRLLHGSFVCSYLLTFLGLHAGADGSRFAPVSLADVDAYRFIPLGLHGAASEAAFALCALAYAGCLAGAAASLLRAASPRDLLPAGALILVQGLWFPIPLLLRRFGVETGIDPWESPYGAYYFLWIAVGHALQYVWITSWYAKAGPGLRGQAAYFGRAMLAGAAIWTLPALVFAPGLLGSVSYDAGLGLLVASSVNIHHFILDGAIWKLRDGRVARILLRQRRPEEAIEAGTRRLGLAPLVYAVGALCFVLMFAMKWEREIGVKRAAAAGDLERMRVAIERLSSVGRDDARIRHQLGSAYTRKGRDAEALAQLARAAELEPNAATSFAIGRVHARNERWADAARAYEEAIALGGEDDRLFYQLGLARLRLDQPSQAAQAFERAATLNPERRINQIMLERARAAADAAS